MDFISIFGQNIQYEKYNMSDSLNICLSCGFCCDGTLIGFVQLSEKEIPALREILDIEEVDKNGFFFLPCKNISPKGCKIYEQRPGNCRKFNCKMLNSIEQDMLCFKDAIETIEVMKQKKVTIEKQIAESQIELKSKSFYYKILELKILLKNYHIASTSLDHKSLISNLNDLDDLCLKTFGITFD